MSESHPALGQQFTTAQTRQELTPAARFKAEMDYRYDNDPDRQTDERYEKRRDL